MEIHLLGFRGGMRYFNDKGLLCASCCPKPFGYKVSHWSVRLHCVIILHLLCRSKFYISLATVKPDLPVNYGEESWKKLRVSVQAVFEEHPISYSLEELYQAVENMCSHGMAAKLYDDLGTECQDHVMSIVPFFQQYPVYLSLKRTFPSSLFATTFSCNFK